MRATPTRFAAPIAITFALLFAALTLAAAASAALVPVLEGPGTPLREGGRVLVDVRFERGAAAGLGQLRAAGARIVHLSRRDQTVTVAARPGEVAALRGVARVEGVSRVLTPQTMGVDCGGLVRSEGDTQLLASTARANLGVDGTGVTVGILSDSFDRDPGAPTRAATDVATGDLPGPGSPCGSTDPVAVLSDTSGEIGDEGRAMAQIVRDLAPGASISFATAFLGEASFAAGIRQLAARGAKVIADDVVYFQEPFFQDGPIAVAVDEVAAAGVSYFSAAGNNNVISAGGDDVGSWEAQYRDAGSCPAGLPAGEESCVDFDPDPDSSDRAFNFIVPKNGLIRIDLQWAEPRGGVKTDFDAYLLDAGGNVVDESTSRNVKSTQLPFEFVQAKNSSSTETASARLVISRVPDEGTPGAPVLKFIQFGDAEPAATQYETSSAGDLFGPTVFGHAAAAGAISVGAVRFNTTSAPEEFSSRGPVVKRFGPVLGSAPAAALGLPQAVAEPDLVATNGGVNTFFGSPAGSAWRFYGTSAAAPHAAAVAALALQANPGATPGQIRAALTATARPVGVYGPSAVGAGLVDAAAAVDSVALSPTVAVTRAPAERSRVRHPSVEFAASRPASFRCVLDGAALPCTSPFTWPQQLADGRHTLLVEGTDLGGRTGASPAVSFEVDTKAPRTWISQRPRTRIVTRRPPARVHFKFRSNESASFRCKVDAGPYLACGKRMVKRFALGRHVLRVKARDRVGNVDRSPAVFRFRVVRPR